MAASYFGGEVKETRRHKLGKLSFAIPLFVAFSVSPRDGFAAAPA